MKIIALPGNPDFTNSLQAYFNQHYPNLVDFVHVKAGFFASGEPSIEITESVRKSEVFVLATCSASYPSIVNEDFEKRSAAAFEAWESLSANPENLPALRCLLFSLAGIEVNGELTRLAVQTSIAQQFKRTVNDNFMQLLVTIDAIKRASASGIIPVLPFYPCGRQDRKDRPRVPISAKLVAHLIQNSCGHRFSGFITTHLHVPQIQGFFDGPVDDLPMTSLIAADILAYLDKRNLTLNDIVIVAPDIGGNLLAKNCVKQLNESGKEGFCEIAVLDKVRRSNGSVESLLLQNNTESPNIVKGKIAIIIDDMIDRGGTSCEAVKILKTKYEASHGIIYATHGILSDPAVENLSNSVFDDIVLSDTLPLPPHAQNLKNVRTLTLVPYIAEAMWANTNDHGSISGTYSVAAMRSLYQKAGVPLGGATL